MHDLLREYAGELSDRSTTPQPTGAWAVHRVLDHVSAHRVCPRTNCSARAATTRSRWRLVPPLVTPETLADYRDALAWLATERQALLAALRQAVSYGFDAHAWQLAWAVTSYFDLHGHWYDAAASHRGRP